MIQQKGGGKNASLLFVLKCWTRQLEFSGDKPCCRSKCWQSPAGNYEIPLFLGFLLELTALLEPQNVASPCCCQQQRNKHKDCCTTSSDTTSCKAKSDLLETVESCLESCAPWSTPLYSRSSPNSSPLRFGRLLIRYSLYPSAATRRVSAGPIDYRLHLHSDHHIAWWPISPPATGESAGRRLRLAPNTRHI